MAILFLKAVPVRGYLRRRATGGGKLFVAPHQRTGKPTPLPAPVHVARAVELALPGATRAVHFLARRLLPHHRLEVVPMDERETRLPGSALGATATAAQRMRLAFPNIPATFFGQTPPDEARGRPSLTIEMNLAGSTTESASRVNIARTLLHEFGHAFACARFGDAPEDMRRAVVEQWWQEAGSYLASRNTVSRKGNTWSAASSAATIYAIFAEQPEVERLTRQNASQRGTTPEAMIEDMAWTRDYYASLDEWMAERFVEWCRTTTEPRTALDRFFHGLLAILSAGFAKALQALGIPPRESGAFARFADAAWNGELPARTRSQFFGMLD